MPPLSPPTTLPLPTPGSLRAAWSTPRFDTLSKPHHFHAQLQFWSAYSTDPHPLEPHLPEKLQWRRKQLVAGIVETLQRLMCAPVANRYLYELGVLQRGWDEVMGEIYAYFEETDHSITPPPSPSDPHLGLHVPPYIANYARTDTAVYEQLSLHPPATHHNWGMDPLRPDIADATKKAAQVVLLGPIVTVGGEVGCYRCAVEGCKGNWWFESALRAHEGEVPHRMVVEW